MNQFICIGRMTSNIEVKYTESGKAVGRFSLALDRGKDSEGNDRGADFPNFVTFGKAAEVLQKWTEKGSRVSVIGHVQTGSYEKDGKKVYTTDIVVDRVEIIDFKKKDESIPDGFQEYDDEDVPF